MTLLQVLLSVIVILISIVGSLVGFYDETLDDKKTTIVISLSGSLFAAGSVSAIFSILKFYEEKGSSESFSDLNKSIFNLNQDLAILKQDLDKIKSECFLVQDFPQTHTIIKSHPTEEVTAAIADVAKESALEIDALGLNLNQFYEDQVSLLRDRESIAVRILIQNPHDPMLEEICRYEGREVKNVQNRIFTVTQNWIQNHSDAKIADQRQLLLAWSNQFHSITMVRVNDTIFMRPRIINEAEIGNVVYEVYRRNTNPNAFKCYKDYFEEAWRMSAWPDKDACANGSI